MADIDKLLNTMHECAKELKYSSDEFLQRVDREYREAFKTPDEKRKLTLHDFNRVVKFSNFVTQLECFRAVATDEEFQQLRPILNKIKERLEDEIDNPPPDAPMSGSLKIVIPQDWKIIND